MKKIRDKVREKTFGCTCGCTTPHEIARRQTTNGVTIVLWSNGCVSDILGINVWSQQARSADQHATHMEAGWLLMGEVEMYNSTDVQQLVKHTRHAVRQQRQPKVAYLRRAMAGRTEPSPPSPRAGEGFPDASRALARYLASMGWELDAVEIEIAPTAVTLLLRVSKFTENGARQVNTLHVQPHHRRATLTREIARWKDRNDRRMTIDGTGGWNIFLLGRDSYDTPQEALHHFANYLEDNAPNRASAHVVVNQLRALLS